MVAFDKFLFIHIPKTGGVSINTALEAKGYRNVYGHKFARDIKAGASGFSDRFVITVVRNPWDRLISTWAFATKGSEIHKAPEAPYIEALADNFPDFVRRLYDLNIGKGDVYVARGLPNHAVNLYTRHQVNWTKDVDGTSLVDVVGKTHNIQGFLQDIKLCTGVDLDYIHRNRTPHTGRLEMYDEETSRMVEELYAPDIEEFGFSFQEGGSK